MNHFEDTVAINGFSMVLLPVNQHHRMFFGVGIRKPLVLMIFNGCPTLVRRWNGYIPSLKSSFCIQMVETYKVGLSTSERKNKSPGPAVEKSESLERFLREQAKL